MAIQFFAAYIIKDREISYGASPTTALGSLTEDRQIIYLGWNGQKVHIDLTKMILREQLIDYTQTLIDFLTVRLTDKKVVTYTANHFPIRDRLTERYPHRIDCYDAMQASDLNISFGDVNDPTNRNNPYYRATQNDLILDSTNRDFSNALVTVNGVFHKTTFWEKELFVQGGFFNLRNNEGQKNIQVIDTSTVGGHTTLPIALDNFTNLTEQSIQQGVYLNFPGVDFRGKTVLLSIGGYLYAFDDTYHVLGAHRLKLDICKMDLINQYIHNPNTLYYEPYGDLTKSIAQYNDAGLDPPYVAPHPSNHDILVYYLQSIYTSVLEQPSSLPNVLSQFNYSDLYSEVSSITQTISLSELLTESFVCKILTDPSTFVIILNNPDIYVRKYPLVPALDPAQYLCISEDTPRGILRYNKNKSFPYTILSGSDGTHHHTLSLNYAQTETDVYKSVPQVPTLLISSPFYDGKSNRERYPAELLELYAV